MSPALLSLLALLLVVAASLTSRVNVGVLAVALAWGIATFAADWKVDQLMAVFPSSLFLTLLGVTLLFGIAQANGTMQVVTRRGVRLLRGRSALLPPFVFLLSCLISTSGPGSIATTALMAPLAMGLAQRAKAPMLLMALMVGNGANAGNLSPISAIGALVQTLMEKAGLGGHATEVLVMNFVAHAIVATAAWAMFGGPAMRPDSRLVEDDEDDAFTRALPTLPTHAFLKTQNSTTEDDDDDRQKPGAKGVRGDHPKSLPGRYDH
jgi:Na+/H+ antiporter NhaC